MVLHHIYDVLHYLVITSSFLPSEFFWLSRLFGDHNDWWANNRSSVWQQGGVGPIRPVFNPCTCDMVCSEFAVFFTPFSKLYELPIVQFIAVGGETVSWARTIVYGIDCARLYYPGSISAILLLSIAGGGIGGLLSQYELRSWATTQQELKSIVYSPKGVNLSLCMGILYVVLSHAFVFEQDTLKAIICGSLLVLSYLSYFGVPVDPIALISPSAKIKSTKKQQ